MDNTDEDFMRPRHYAELIMKLPVEEQEAALNSNVPEHYQNLVRQHLVHASLAYAAKVRAISDRIMALPDKNARKEELGKVHEHLRKDVETECWRRYKTKMAGSR